ncbi:unnamed protein product [Leptidea sinapis]|uniref:Carboxylic ester hydrolase n=1 Tax=Leptidea sinapis TaxID=189913 RepID=A0A5E4Q449_9NEOP|nr:unnamed protein product [Leptidea sinapis]
MRVMWAARASAGRVRPLEPRCEVRAHVAGGWVCGASARADQNTLYASFRGVPYATQPLGQLRFKGPICPQHDVIYGNLVEPSGISEACIHANIHVPMYALPGSAARVLQDSPESLESGLPVMVFIHGGGFAAGSGDRDLHGPEYLMRRGVIVITFNYRLNVMGFLSLNTSRVPGNNGLRDMVTLLRWVRSNIKSFGGDPEQVTIAGHSAGAASAHLLTLSPAAKGLFKRAILMSGTAIPSFYTTSPIYANFVTNMFLQNVGINSTDPEEIHRRLVTMNIQQMMNANRIVQDQIGVTAFLPVVETPFSGVTTILDEDPQVLLSRGVGKDIPLLIGYTSAECEFFRPNFEKIDIVSQIKQNPLMLLPINKIYSLPPKIGLEYAKNIEKRYFNGETTMSKYIKYCTDVYYEFPALEISSRRPAFLDAAPVFLYKFSYQPDYSVLKEGKGLMYKGACHGEDLTFILKPNSDKSLQDLYTPLSRDSLMKDWMTWMIHLFVYCDDPTCTQFQQEAWPATNTPRVHYQHINNPGIYRYTGLTDEQQGKLQFFESVFGVRT